jgi:hypothetical protein
MFVNRLVSAVAGSRYEIVQVLLDYAVRFDILDNGMRIDCIKHLILAGKDHECFDWLLDEGVRFERGMLEPHIWNRLHSIRSIPSRSFAQRVLQMTNLSQVASRLELDAIASIVPIHRRRVHLLFLLE